MTALRPILILCLLLVTCFTLATFLQPLELKLGRSSDNDSILKTVLGDGRRMFANHYFVKADVYFHSGYYPSLIEQGYAQTPTEIHIAEHRDGTHDDDEKNEPGANFLGQSKDWIDNFSRHFYSSTHSHLDQPGEAREILPWLRLSAELDPQKIDTYTVASYWLRTSIGKPHEAEQFLREGLRANPDSYEILLELGRLYNENLQEPDRAKNVWELALRRWQEQDKRWKAQDQAAEKPDSAIKEPDVKACDQILAQLVNAEEKQGNLPQALLYLKMQLDTSPITEGIKKHIEEINEKLASHQAH